MSLARCRHLGGLDESVLPAMEVEYGRLDFDVTQIDAVWDFDGARRAALLSSASGSDLPSEAGEGDARRRSSLSAGPARSSGGRAQQQNAVQRLWSQVFRRGRGAGKEEQADGSGSHKHAGGEHATSSLGKGAPHHHHHSQNYPQHSSKWASTTSTTTPNKAEPSSTNPLDQFFRSLNPPKQQ